MINTLCLGYTTDHLGLIYFNTHTHTLEHRYKLEKDAPHIARELLKQLGWGISNGRERVLSHRHRDYVAPELWSYLRSNYFVDLEQQSDFNAARRMRRFDSVSRDRVMQSMNFDRELSSPAFDTTASSLSNRKSVRIKNMTIVKKSGEKSNRDAMLRTWCSSAKRENFNHVSHFNAHFVVNKYSNTRSTLFLKTAYSLSIRPLEQQLNTGMFASIRMRHSESVADYEKRLQLMRNKVVDSTGFPISDDLAVMTLFNGLRIEIASRIFEQQRKDFPGIIHSSYDKRAKWLLSLEIDETYVEFSLCNHSTTYKLFSSNTKTYKNQLRIGSWRSCLNHKGRIVTSRKHSNRFGITP